MLDKAWPSELKEGSKRNEKEKDVILLKHLLTWSTWPGFLKFFGKKSNELGDSDSAVQKVLIRQSSRLYNKKTYVGQSVCILDLKP